MKFSEIYKQAIDYWPDEIQIADGYPTGTNGFRFPTLSKVWDQVEDSVDAEDHWGGLAVWCMFQAFHTEARALHRAGRSTLRPRDVAMSEVEVRLSENLKSEGWADHCATYENDLTLS